ncbi:MAG: cell division protein SepF [Lachnospiraceae bacterium]|nr:cell division protein SepF [Lachnospiraceae bacterium]
MSFFDKIMNTFSLNDEDEEYYDDDDFIEEDEEEEQRGLFGRKERKEEEAPKKSKITPMRTSRKNKGGDSDREITMFKPTSDTEVCDIIDALLADRTVVLNLEGINEALAEKVINTVSGATYALSGNMVKISGFIFIIAPRSVELSGDNSLEASKAPAQNKAYEFARVAGGRF